MELQEVEEEEEEEEEEELPTNTCSFISSPVVFAVAGTFNHPLTT